MEEAINAPQIKKIVIKLSQEQEERIMVTLKNDMAPPVQMGSIVGARVGAVIGSLVGIAGGPAAGGVAGDITIAYILNYAISQKSKREC